MTSTPNDAKLHDKNYSEWERQKRALLMHGGWWETMERTPIADITCATCPWYDDKEHCGCG